MPSSNQPPYADTQAARHEERLSNLEKKRPLAAPAQQLAPLRFTALGPASAGSESTREPIDGAVVAIQVVLSLLANATADHTVEIRVSGLPIQQFTLPSGSAISFAGCHIVMFPGSYMTVKLITDIDSDLLVKLKLQPH
jgi:hypothetical protein